ncbi:MAG TPA: His-Xaa-Ser system radical SAM maturase HxsC [Allosphingosinicella sp.]|nr:His-Xaa-Ser system radical SAM maturase HxsC [Allosphingosinicella sp.]
MIPLVLPAEAEAKRPFVTRLRVARDGALAPADSYLVGEDPDGAAFAGPRGLIAIDGVPAGDLDGDVVLVHPAAERPGRIERILRAGSPHNTLLVTERCDQLCVMCSQPPKKTHVDRFGPFEEACLLAEPGTLIGVSGGEPTLYKDALLGMMERVLAARPDLEFHVLSNAQHFEAADVARLRNALYRRVSWGIPLYAPEPGLHDEIVGKAGAFARLEESFAHLVMAGARVELRTVLLGSNLDALPALARHISGRLRFIEMWSIMQLENTGFAKNRWSTLYLDHRGKFDAIGQALELAALHGVPAQLFNFPRCSVPGPFRDHAVASISDWKRKFMPACAGCREREACCGFFEWHPDKDAQVTPL